MLSTEIVHSAPFFTVIAGICGAEPAEDGFDDPNVGAPTHLNTLSNGSTLFIDNGKCLRMIEEGDAITLFGKSDIVSYHY